MPPLISGMVARWLGRMSWGKKEGSGGHYWPRTQARIKWTVGVTPEIIVGDAQVSPRLALLLHQVHPLALGISFWGIGLVSGNQRKLGLDRRHTGGTDPAVGASPLGGCNTSRTVEKCFNILSPNSEDSIKISRVGGQGIHAKILCAYHE